MENLIFTINIVLPLFLLIALGAFIKKIKVVDDGFSASANALSFKVLLPVLLFNNIFTCDISSVMDVKLMFYAGIGSTLLIFVTVFFVMIFEKDNARRGTMMQAIMRSNYLLFATPLCAAIFPKNGAAMASIVSIIVIPVQNIGSVIMLTIFNGKAEKSKLNIKKMLIGVLKNPFIIASILAIIMLLLKVELPQFLSKAVNNISSMATPFALIMLGTELRLNTLKSNAKALLWVTVSKLILCPLIMLSIGIALGFRDTAYAVLLSLYASPTAVSSYVMAKGAGADGELAAQCVVSTSFFSLFTVFAFIYLSKMLGFI